MKPTHIHTEADLETALAALVAADPRFAKLIAAAGRPPCWPIAPEQIGKTAAAFLVFCKC